MQTEWDTKHQQNGQILYLDTCIHYIIYGTTVTLAPGLFCGVCTAVLWYLLCSFEVPALQFCGVCTAV